eukprot:4351080-Amphidinium_carterae.1
MDLHSGEETNVKKYLVRGWQDDYIIKRHDRPRLHVWPRRSLCLCRRFSFNARHQCPTPGGKT